MLKDNSEFWNYYYYLFNGNFFFNQFEIKKSGFYLLLTSQKAFNSRPY
jgi:hypothetical protein